MTTATPTRRERLLEVLHQQAPVADRHAAPLDPPSQSVAGLPRGFGTAYTVGPPLSSGP